jgi:hypothetical protein
LEGVSRRVPDPTITASADARRRPMMNRSALLNPLISPPPDFPGISKLTTPSSAYEIPNHIGPIFTGRKSQVSPIKGFQFLR